MRPLSFLFGFILVLTFSRGKAVAALTNLIIDDTNQEYWTFIGSQWNAITPTTPCTGCVTKPNAALAYNTTWHNSVLGSGSFSFQGTAVYIYGIDTPVQFSANISFQMDDPPTTSFHYYAGSDYVYNSLFFAATNLSSSVPHVVSWLTEASPTEGRSVLLDYGQITVEQQNPLLGSAGNVTTPSSLPRKPASDNTVRTRTFVSALVGAIIGSALLGGLVSVLIFRRCRRRRSRMSAPPRPVSSNTVEPFRGHPPANVPFCPKSVAPADPNQIPAVNRKMEERRQLQWQMQQSAVALMLPAYPGP